MGTWVVPLVHPPLQAPDSLLRCVVNGVSAVPRRIVVEPKQARDVEVLSNVRRDGRQENPFGEPRFRNFDCLFK
jgi:hypothetical protein